jgi:hypothetical protein
MADRALGSPAFKKGGFHLVRQDRLELAGEKAVLPLPIHAKGEQRMNYVQLGLQAASVNLAVGLTPTEEGYRNLEHAVRFLSDRLFDSLPPVMLEYTWRKGVLGHFWPARFSRRNGESLTDVIALNPQYFFNQPDIEVAVTLGHELGHQWQHHFGKSSPKGYHNWEFANKLDTIGLPTSNTGAPGGKKVGFRMSNYVAPGGPFDLAYQELAGTGWAIQWGDLNPIDVVTVNRKPRKVLCQYVCRGCDLQIEHEEADLQLLCGRCGVWLKTR